jgi:large subunit ribosomal protein L21
VVQGEKLYIHKFRTKKAFKKKTGHRQRYTAVKITGITA